MVYQNQERYTNTEDLRNDITIEAGYYTKRENIQGDTMKQANSISFASMDEHEFSDYYNKCLDVIVKYFKFDKQLIQDNIEQYF